MTTENEKVVRDLIYKAWAEWRKSPDALKLAQIVGYEDAVAFPRLFEAGYRAALQSQSNTDGWVMVPTMPTDTQLDRAVSFALNVQISGSYNWTMYMRDVYLRMLSAAPKAPQQVSNTPQDGKVRKALEDLLEQFDPRNHQSFCECDPSVGYQCAACKFPSIPAVIAAHEALATPPQSGEAVNPAKVANIVRNFHRNSCYPEAMGAEVDSAVDAIMRLIANATPTATASQESAPTSDQTGREPT